DESLTTSSNAQFAHSISPDGRPWAWGKMCAGPVRIFACFVLTADSHPVNAQPSRCLRRVRCRALARWTLAGVLLKRIWANTGARPPISKRGRWTMADHDWGWSPAQMGAQRPGIVLSRLQRVAHDRSHPDCADIQRRYSGEAFRRRLVPDDYRPNLRC